MQKLLKIMHKSALFFYLKKCTVRSGLTLQDGGGISKHYSDYFGGETQ